MAKQGVEGELQALLKEEQNAHADHDLKHLLPKLVALYVEVYETRFKYPTDCEGKSAATALKAVGCILVDNHAAYIKHVSVDGRSDGQKHENAGEDHALLVGEFHMVSKNVDAKHNDAGDGKARENVRRRVHAKVHAREHYQRDDQQEQDSWKELLSGVSKRSEKRRRILRMTAGEGISCSGLFRPLHGRKGRVAHPRPLHAAGQLDDVDRKGGWQVCKGHPIGQLFVNAPVKDADEAE